MNRDGAGARNFYVDALRTIAILLVLLSHAPVYLIMPAIKAHTGYYGVSMFFVISGFLITSGILRRYRSLASIDLRSFYLFRASRIGPGLCLLVLLNVTCIYLGISGFALSKQGPDGLPKLLLYVLTFQANHYPGLSADGAWNVLWSLSIEEVFYLLFPLACLAMQRTGVLIAFLCAVVIIGPFVRYTYGVPSLYYYFGCFDQLAIGCLTAFAMLRAAAGFFPSCLLLISGALSCVAAQTLVDPLSFMGPTTMAIGAALFIAGGTGLSSPPTLVLRLLTLAGEWSYELYLFHNPLLIVIGASGLLPIMRFHLGESSASGLALAFVLVFSGGLSVFVFSPLSRHIRSWRGSVFWLHFPTASHHPAVAKSTPKASELCGEG
jgi:peptidoglycan/LPS O-acetylase OafA/YrhL